MAPTRLSYHSCFSTSEDHEHPAKELDQQGPHSRGWRSRQFCIYPQELVFQLAEKAHVDKIQILLHQLLIPERVEFFIGAVERGKDVTSSNAKFARLGSVSLSTNHESGYKARESKTVDVDCEGQFIKLVIHKNHLNKTNKFNQVSIMGVNFIGTENAGSNTTSSQPSSGDRQLANYDDLAFNMYVDHECVKTMQKLEARKTVAAKNERFEYAKNCKDAVQLLHMGGLRLGKYHIEKRMAIEEENYDKAKLKKDHAEEYKESLMDALRVEQLLERDGTEPKNNASLGLELPPPPGKKRPPEPTPSPPPPPRPSSDPLPPIRPISEMLPRAPPSPIRKPLTPPPPLRTPATPPKREAPTPKREKSPPRRRHTPPQREKSHPKLSPRKQPDPPPPAMVYRAPLSGRDASPLPPRQPPRSSIYRTRQEPIAKYAAVTDRTPLYMASISAPRPAEGATPRRRTDCNQKSNRHRGTNPNPPERRRPHGPRRHSDSAHQTRRGRMLMAGINVGDVGSRAPPPPTSSKLTDAERKDAALAIEVFGEPMVENFYTKNFVQKEEGFRALINDLRNDNGSVKPDKKTRAAAFLLMRGLKDKMYAVCQQAVETLAYLTGPYASKHKTSNRELGNTMEAALPELTQKLGENATRVQSMASESLLQLAATAHARDMSHVTAALAAPLKGAVQPRVALARFETVEKIVIKYGVTEDGPQSTRALSEFGLSAVEQPSDQLRSAGSRLILLLYPEDKQAVRQVLPPLRKDSNSSMKALYVELDRQDGKKSTVASLRLDSPAELRDIPESSDGRTQTPDEPVLSRSIRASTLEAAAEAGQPSAAEDDEERTCVFCGEANDRFETEEGMEYHFWKSCPMLTRCTRCKQAVEVATYTEHLLRDCKDHRDFKCCTRCQEAVPAKDYDYHVRSYQCIPAKSGPAGNHCPLCHQNTPPYDAGWRQHLTKECPANKRNPTGQARAGRRGSEAPPPATSRRNSVTPPVKQAPRSRIQSELASRRRGSVAGPLEPTPRPPPAPRRRNSVAAPGGGRSLLGKMAPRSRVGSIRSPPRSRAGSDRAPSRNGGFDRAPSRNGGFDRKTPPEKNPRHTPPGKDGRKVAPPSRRSPPGSRGQNHGTRGQRSKTPPGRNPPPVGTRSRRSSLPTPTDKKKGGRGGHAGDGKAAPRGAAVSKPGPGARPNPNKNEHKRAGRTKSVSRIPMSRR